MKRIDKVIGPLAYQQAQQMATYGRCDWVVYKGKDGISIAERQTADSVKRALLAVGTSGHFTQLIANYGSGMYTTWKIGLNIWYQLKYSSDYRKGPGIPYIYEHCQQIRARK